MAGLDGAAPGGRGDGPEKTIQRSQFAGVSGWPNWRGLQGQAVISFVSQARVLLFQ